MSDYELLMTLVAGGWAGAAVYINGRRIHWMERAKRAERPDYREEWKP